jgi:hypothetical protein
MSHANAMRIESELSGLSGSAASYDNVIGKSVVPSADSAVCEKTTVGVSVQVLEASKVLGSQIYERFVRPSLSVPTVGAYGEFIAKIWPQYMDAQRGYYSLMSGAFDLPRAVAWAERTRKQAVDAVRARVTNLAGTDACLEIDFAEKTLARANRMLNQIVVQGSVSGSHQPEDMKCAASYESGSAMWSFQMCSLWLATHDDERIKIAPGVMHLLLAYLRAASLFAHGAARKALQLRRTPLAAQLDLVASADREQDEETRLLVASAEHDVITDLLHAES